MIVIPGLSKPLAVAGKRIGGWHEGDDRLWVPKGGPSSLPVIRHIDCARPLKLLLSETGELLSKAALKVLKRFQRATA